MSEFPTWADVWLVLPLLVLLAASIFPLTVKVLNKNQEQGSTVTVFQALAGIGVAIFFIVNQTETTTAFSGVVSLDGLAHWSNLIVLILAGFCLFLSRGNPATKSEQFSEHVFLVLSACMGMLVIAWTTDLIVAFIGIELMSLAFYVLCGLSIEQKISKEAAFKYFILGSFGSAIFLYGVALIYGTVGSTSILEFAAQAPDLIQTSPLFMVGSVLLLVGLFFKVSVFPFHAWTPDVYQGAPTPVTAFMSTAGKLVAFVLLIRILGSGFLRESPDYVNVLQWLAVLTMLVGNIAALRQDSLKRVLAYSSIAHTGYALVGLVAMSVSVAPGFGASSVIFYFLAYGLMNIGAFAVVSLCERTEQTMVSVDDLKGLAKKHPILAASLTICLLSLAGIPPTIGFFGKFFVFSAAIAEGFIWLAVWGVINSVISVYYYLRPVVNMYMKDADRPVEINSDWLSRFALVSASVAIVLAGIFSESVMEEIAGAVARVFG